MCVVEEEMKAGELRRQELESELERESIRTSPPQKSKVTRIALKAATGACTYLKQAL